MTGSCDYICDLFTFAYTLANKIPSYIISSVSGSILATEIFYTYTVSIVIPGLTFTLSLD